MTRRIPFISVVLLLSLAPLFWWLRTRTRTPQKDRSPISLSIERQGKVLRLSWNASWVQHANSAVLFISDGANKRRIDLSRTALERGSVLYTPDSDEVDFKLDAFRVVGSESIRFVADDGTGQTARSSVLRNLLPSNGTKPGRVGANAPRLPRFTSAVGRRRSVRSRAVLRGAILEAVAPLSVPASNDRVMAEEAVPLPLSSQPAIPEGLLLRQIVLPPPRLPVNTVAYEAAPESTLKKWIGNVIAVRPLHAVADQESSNFALARPRQEIDPDVPSFIANGLAEECRVVLRASIDKNGRVTDVEVLPPAADHRLVGSAAAAVRKRDFEPARSKGRAVPSRMLLTFKFRNPSQSAGTE